MSDTTTDLFNDYDNLPLEVQSILDRYCDGGDETYEICEALIKELNAIGYTCDYGLDASPHSLRKLSNLEQYQQWLLAFNRANPISSRPDSPAHFGFQTLWIPFNSSNRTARLDLNHTIDERPYSDIVAECGGRSWFVPNVECLFGYNGNCNTLYLIIEVPKHFTYDSINELCIMVTERLDKPIGYPHTRVLKADARMHTIIAVLNEFENLRAK